MIVGNGLCPFPPNLTAGDNGYFPDSGPVTWNRLGQGLNYTFCKDTGMLWTCSKLRALWFLAPVRGYPWFSAIAINQEFLLKETDAVCSPANPHHAFRRTPYIRLLLHFSFPPFLTSSHMVYVIKRHPCQTAEFQLTSTMQFFCIPGPHHKQPAHSPSWHTSILLKPGMLLLP